MGCVACPMLLSARAHILAALTWSSVAGVISTGRRRSSIEIPRSSACITLDAGAGCGLLSWLSSPGVKSVCVQTLMSQPLTRIMSSLIMVTPISSLRTSFNHYVIHITAIRRMLRG